MNPTDQTTLNISGTYAFGAQLGCNGQYLNALVDHGAFEIDFTGGFDLSDSFFLGINVAYFDNDEDVSFAGVALYPQLATSDNFTIGLRGEYFTETNLGAIGANDINGDANVFAVTLTGSATIGDLIINGLIGFILGFKLLLVAMDWSEFITNTQDVILSTKGHIAGGIIGGLLMMASKYWERRKEAEEHKGATKIRITTQPHEMHREVHIYYYSPNQQS